MSLGNNIENTTKLYSGQGSLFFRLLDSDENFVGGWFNVGNCESVSFDLAVEQEEILESQSGQRSVFRKLSAKKTANISIETSNFDAEIATLGLFGTSTLEEAGAAVKTDTAYVGCAIPLDGFAESVESVTNEDETITYVEGIDYTISDSYVYITRGGSIVDGSTVVINYTKSQARVIQGLVKNEVNVAVMFTGVNTAEGDKPVRVEFFKVSLSPSQQRNLITASGVANQQIQGSVLSANRIVGTGLSKMFKEVHAV
jgi:hypothetical protein